MQKNMLLAIVLSILVLLTFNHFLSRGAPPGNKPFPSQIAPEAEKVQAGAPVFSPPLQERGLIPAREAGEARVETSFFKAAIALEGAGFKSWELKKYEDKEEPVNLVRSGAPPSGLPLSIGWPEAPGIIFQGDERLKLEAEGAQGVLFLKAREASWEIGKKFAFSGQEHLFWLDISWKNLGRESRKAPDYYLTCSSGFGPQNKEARQYAEIKAGLFDGVRLKPKRWKVASLNRQLVRRNRTTGEITRLEQDEAGIIKWIAYRGKYFAVIIKPEEEGRGLLFSSGGDNDVLCRLKMAGQEINPGEVSTQRFAVYLGPIDYDRLQDLNLGLETIFDSGGLAPLRKLVMKILKFFYGLVGNWGVAIILLTFVAKIVLLPLTQKSFRSMREMQKLQPQISSLRQVYKDTPQKLQKETMELYRRHKVNPLGGCFPMLLQMPVFIALFTALRGAIELRQAPFMLWIQDLSAKDPFYVLPILMGGMMFAQQKMTPSADPQQARMAMIMPIFFTFIFMNFPSGLVLYWLVNSILSFGEQWWIKKKK